MKKIGKWFVAILALVVVAEGLIAFDVIPNPFRKRTPFVEYGEAVRINETLEESLHEIGELYTMEYTYTMQSTTTNPLSIFGFEMPVGEKKLSYLYSGSLRVGVDLAKASVRERNQVITVTFPKLIAHNTYDENSVEFYDVKQYSFNKKALENYQATRIANEADILAKAEEHGIREKAVENLKVMLNNQLKAILDITGSEEQYTIEVVVESEELDLD